MNQKEDDICYINPEEGEKHTATLFFLHGLGDVGKSWLVCLKRIKKKIPYMKIVLPTAPTRKVTCNKDMIQTAWHNIINMITIDEEKVETFEGLEDSIKKIHELIDKEIQSGIRSDRIFLGGFSQGACLSIHAGYKYSKPLGGIIALSGYLPHYENFANMIHPENKNTPLFLCHGDADTIVLLYKGERIKNVLSKVIPVEYKMYPDMGHFVIEEEIGDIIQFILKRLSTSA